jgi:hypothetical protein
MRGSVFIQRETEKKFTWEEPGVFGGNIEIIATTNIYEVFARIYFVSEGQITSTTNRCF